MLSGADLFPLPISLWRVIRFTDRTLKTVYRWIVFFFSRPCYRSFALVLRSLWPRDARPSGPGNPISPLQPEGGCFSSGDGRDAGGVRRGRCRRASGISAGDLHYFAWGGGMKKAGMPTLLSSLKRKRSPSWRYLPQEVPQWDSRLSMSMQSCRLFSFSLSFMRR